MGLVINFPESRRVSREDQIGGSQSATIMILPVVRIERVTDEPPLEANRPGTTPGGKRRRRSRRS